MPGEKVRLTEEQQIAVELQGNNLLVSAAAGSGKTFVLVERIIRQLLSQDNPCDIERLLVVTFTEKAALEMKERIRSALQEAAAQNPEDLRIARQLSMLERAQISTIHSFCLNIVRRYFYRVDLDPGFRVLDPNEAELLRYEAVDDVFEARYGSDSGDQRRFLELVEGYGGKGVDEGLKQMVLSFHDFLQTQPYPEDWLNSALGMYARLQQALKDSAGTEADFDGIMLELPWTQLLLGHIEAELSEAVSCLRQAYNLCTLPGGPDNYLGVLSEEVLALEDARSIVQRLITAGDGSKLAALRELAGFKFKALPSRRPGSDPSVSDMAKELRDRAKRCVEKIKQNVLMRPSGQVLREIAEVAPLLETFVSLVVELDREYRRRKKGVSGVDFSDLERYALGILRQEGGRLAQEIRACYDYIFVDEYQDTNPIQEEILSLVSRGNNVFMVGDIKQSIYRFRLADPTIFIRKYNEYVPVDRSSRNFGAWDAPGVRTGLSLNFRSRKQVIDAVNYLFGRIMKQHVAEIDYTGEHRLNPGAQYPPTPGCNLAAELILVERENFEDNGDLGSAQEGEPEEPSVDGDLDVEQLEALEREALVVAHKIKEMVEGEHPFMVWDEKASQFRQCMFRDIAVLMRSTKGRANVVLDVFQKCGIPAYAELGTGYFRAREVEVALSLLAVIDNPRQDIPLASVLRSPAVGLTPRELAIIRAICPRGEFYDCVVKFASLEPEQVHVPDPLSGSLDALEMRRVKDTLRQFLDRLERWRTMARRMPLAQVMWAVLAETGYYDYVGGLPGGAQRQANLRALVNRAMDFDKFGRHGLFRFLRFVERIRESKGDLGSARALGEQENVVRVLSVHKAKGLEFPVVFVIDLGKQFNMEDLDRDILFHKDLGIGAMYCDLANRVKYPTLPLKANEIQIRKDNLAEEMRVLYVAMTRAKEKLCLVGSVRGLVKHMVKWQDLRLDRARTYLDWICPAVLPKLTQALAQSVSVLPGLSREADTCSPAEEGLSIERDKASGEGGHAPDAEPIPFDVQVFGLPGTPGIPGFLSRTGQGDDMWDRVKHLMPLPEPGDPEVREQVRRRLEWEYPFRTFTQIPAKMSVSELKSRLDAEEEFRETVPAPGDRELSRGKRKGAIERGIAVHALLARVDLAKAGCEDALWEQIRNLSAMGLLDSRDITPEDVSRIARFFRSETGIRLAASPHKVKREVPFTIGIPVTDTGLHLDQPVESTAWDSVVVQGVIDVIFEADDGLWIIDYKTDSVGPQQIPQTVRSYTPQVALYAYAAEKILGTPVTRVSLVFLTPGEEVSVDWRAYLSCIRLDDVLPLIRG